MQSVSKMLPDEDDGVQLWCWLLFGQVWRMPVQSSDRSGPQHRNCWSPRSCSLVQEDLEQHYSQQSWGTILFAEPSFCRYSLKARLWKGTSITMARIGHYTPWSDRWFSQAKGLYSGSDSSFVVLFASLYSLAVLTVFGVSCLEHGSTIFSCKQNTVRSVKCFSAFSFL